MFRYIFLRLLAFCFLAATATASAADEEPAAPDAVEETEEIEDVEDMQVAAVAGGFLVQSPSGKRGLTEWTRYEGPLMTLNLGLMVIGDYNMFDQDTASVAQVGRIPSETELRAGRLMLRGNLARSTAACHSRANI